MFDESAAEAWRLRFGEEAPAPAGDLAPFLRHRSVRQFNGREVSEDLAAALFGCAQSAATSSHLQMWSAISIQDPERREAIAALCGSQEQVRTAPWFWAFIADASRVRRAAEAGGEDPSGLDTVEMLLVAAIDAALAGERMACAAESLGLGTCWIGALRNHPADVKDLLGLPAGAAPLFGLCLGWPAEGAAAIKPRFRSREVWFREGYGEPSAEEFNGRMAEFYASQGMSAAHTWAQRMGRRCREESIGSRMELQSFLASQGLGVR